MKENDDQKHLGSTSDTKLYLGRISEVNLAKEDSGSVMGIDR